MWAPAEAAEAAPAAALPDRKEREGGLWGFGRAYKGRVCWLAMWAERRTKVCGGIGEAGMMATRIEAVERKEPDASIAGGGGAAALC